jgi:glycosyltransferase involved in cell wall biosynthesis
MRASSSSSAQIAALDRAPLVSVGMPAFNSERTLLAAVESILTQDFADLELIISDNASTDGTSQIAMAYAARDQRVRYYRQPTNIGVHRNYNFVFQQARGRYFKWASSNDCCASSFVSRCVEELERNPRAVLASPRTMLVLEDGSHQRSDDDLHLTARSPLERYAALRSSMRLNNAMNGLMRADALRRTALYRGFRGADVNMMAELVVQGEFVALEQYLFFRTMDRKSASRLKTRKEVEAYYRPQGRSPMRMQIWAADLNYVARSLTAPTDIRTRLRLLTFNLREMIRHRTELAADLFQVFQSER